MLDLDCIFHLNLAYSSIEEDQHPEVTPVEHPLYHLPELQGGLEGPGSTGQVSRCYWPLLQLADHYNLPLGIAASAYTLETVAAIDPSWMGELRRLTTEGSCEFIGSGYAQIIGPLVPAEINAANLRLGHQVYERLLGF